MKFARWVFLVAGIYGLLMITPLYFMEAFINKQTPPAISHPEFFYGFVGVGLAWQILFLVVASDPQRFRPMMLPSILEKISYGIALIVLHQQQRIPASSFRIGMIDWIFAVLFMISFLRTPKSAN
ncbi:MAG: hypothetical protein WCA15_20245 [Candidatus Acidiferrales bacterium]